MLNIKIDNYLVYQTNILPGFYDVTSLISNIKLYTSRILHGQNTTEEIKFI